MAEELFPVVDDLPEFIEESSEYDEEYRRSIKWDIELGDFVRNGANQMVEADGREAWATWCFKTTLTDRFANEAYTDSIGQELEAALKETDREIAESMIKRTLTDALMVNPRTDQVTDFTFTWDADEMHCTFWVYGVEWDEPIQISI